ncbi:hypothetical protein RRG08_060851 [Elysia crispata]|uniref:Uncharacterized protein n=1 Tax=Elysia crispata TaxID=231223 RepID=A0AAE0ZFI7_9GAST|nr:hypothetical protein RRG08_060851 [Elysia crispata]
MRLHPLAERANEDGVQETGREDPISNHTPIDLEGPPKDLLHPNSQDLVQVKSISIELAEISLPQLCLLPSVRPGKAERVVAPLAALLALPGLALAAGMSVHSDIIRWREENFSLFYTGRDFFLKFGFQYLMYSDGFISSDLTTFKTNQLYQLLLNSFIKLGSKCFTATHDQLKAWVRYTLFIGGHKETGAYGLWKKCATNETSQTVYCTQTHLAQGPGFLEASRILACIGLVFVVGSMFGYIFADKVSSPQNWKEKVKTRLQEICSISAGIMGVHSSSIHLSYSEDHYTKNLGTDDVNVGEMVIMMLVVSAVTVVNSIVLWAARPPPLPPAKTTTSKPVNKDKVDAKVNVAESKKRWLSSSAVPTPVEQKTTMDLVPTQKTHGPSGAQDTEAGEVEVKKSWTRSIVAPTQVILAIKRLKKGEKRHSEDKSKSTIVVEEEKSLPHEDPNNKLKGIFTVSVDNSKKYSPAPPVPPPVLATPRRRADSETSSSSSNSDISVEAAHTGKKPATQAKGGATISRPTPVVRHFSQNEVELRARAQQTAVVVTDEASVKEAQERSRPGISKRHMTHQESSMRNAVAGVASADGNKLNIYHIPEEPATSKSLPPPPNYEAVVNL